MLGGTAQRKSKMKDGCSDDCVTVTGNSGVHYLVLPLGLEFSLHVILNVW